MDIIFNNDKKIIDEILKYSDLSNEINIITAYFTYDIIIKNWIQQNKEIKIIVSLRPPTDYYLLKDILHNNNITINFLGRELHSKIYIFKNKGFHKAIIGSSNFTKNGFCSNIESNVIIDDLSLLNKIDDYFNDLFLKSNSLEPSDLDKYKSVYDSFINMENKLKENLNEFNKKINYKTRIKKENIKLLREARKYYDFWKIIDDIKNMVKEISDKEYPGIPYYLTIDHFWHWIKVIWNKKIKVYKRVDIIKKLFQEYCNWDKNKGDNYTEEIYNKSNYIFKKYLSIENIDNLTMKNALIVYRNLHSTGMPIQRFNSDEEFKKNSIKNIIKSFKYLLHSKDDIIYKLSKLMDKKSELKLIKFGDSNIQELNGWVNPEIYPIRNDKADDAVKILGYKL